LNKTRLKFDGKKEKVVLMKLKDGISAWGGEDGKERRGLYLKLNNYLCGES